MKQWYYHQNGEESGPVTQVELVRFLALGKLRADTLVWTEGLESWQPAAQVPALKTPPLAKQASTPSRATSRGAASSPARSTRNPWITVWVVLGVTVCGIGFLIWKGMH